MFIYASIYGYIYICIYIYIHIWLYLVIYGYITMNDNLYYTNTDFNTPTTTSKAYHAWTSERHLKELRLGADRFECHPKISADWYQVRWPRSVQQGPCDSWILCNYCHAFPLGKPDFWKKNRAATCHITRKHHSLQDLCGNKYEIPGQEHSGIIRPKWGSRLNIWLHMITLDSLDSDS